MKKPQKPAAESRQLVKWYADLFNVLPAQDGTLKAQIQYPLLLFVHPPGPVKCALPALGRIVHLN